MTFHYTTSAEASGTPASHNWGLMPLNWAYVGRTSDLMYDLWSPPGMNPALSGLRLWIPHRLYLGQFEIHLDRIDLDPAAVTTHDPKPRIVYPRLSSVLWQRNITTRPELDAALLELQELACDANALAVYAALGSSKPL